MSDTEANNERRLSELEQEVKLIKWGLGLVNGEALDMEQRNKANCQHLVKEDMKLAAAEMALSAVVDALLAEADEETRQRVAKSLKRRYEQYKGYGSPFVERYLAVSRSIVPGIDLSGDTPQ